MNKTRNTFLCVLIAAVFILSLVTGCGGNSPENTQSTQPAAANEASGTTAAANGPSKDPITIQMYVGEPWNTSIIDASWTDPVTKYLTEKTGVTLEVTTAKSQDADNEMNVMMASGDLPQIIFKYGNPRKKLVEGGYVQPLDDLIDKEGPNIKKNMGMFMDNWRELDGKVYGLGNWCWNKPSMYTLNLQVNTLNIRYDILKEMGYAKLDRKNPFDSFITVAEYTDLLKQVKAKYPDMIPVLIDTDRSFMGYNPYEVLLKSYGLSIINDTIYEDGKAKFVYESKHMPDVIKYLNSLYVDGYIPKGIATFKTEQNQNLISTGKVFSTLGFVNGLSEAQGALSENNEERRMVYLYLVQDSSVKNLAINGTVNIGSPGIMISSEAKDTDRIMQFFDYCASDEGSLAICGGVEGVTYTKGADGKLLPMDEMYKGYVVWDANTLKKFGVGGWECILPSLGGFGANGQVFDIFAAKTFDENKWAIYNNSDWKNISYINPLAMTADLNQTTQPDAFEASSKINSYIKDRIVKAIIQPTPEKSASEWTKSMEQMKADGLDELDKALSANWNELARAMGAKPDHLIIMNSEK